MEGLRYALICWGGGGQLTLLDGSEASLFVIMTGVAGQRRRK
jgi:hypothetical protein